MESETLYLLALLACPIGMGAMMWMLSKQGAGSTQDAQSSGAQLSTNADGRLATLRAQREMLETEIAEVTTLAELEARREALLKEKAQDSGKVETVKLAAVESAGANSHH